MVEAGHAPRWLVNFRPSQSERCHLEGKSNKIAIEKSERERGFLREGKRWTLRFAWNDLPPKDLHDCNACSRALAGQQSYRAGAMMHRVRHDRLGSMK